MPRIFTPAERLRLAEIAFHRLSNGELLKHITADPDWPNARTLNDWARADPTIAGLIAAGRYNRRLRPFRPYDPAVADAFLQRIRLGMPVRALVREPGYPSMHALRAWLAAQPEFAARYRAAVAAAKLAFHRHAPDRRATRPYDEPTADRVVLEIAGRVEHGIIHGASLHSLSRRPDMPSGYALYRWVRDRPDFAKAVASACEFRDEYLYADRALDLADRGGPAAAPEINAIRKRLGQLNPHPGERRRRHEER